MYFCNQITYKNNENDQLTFLVKLGMIYNKNSDNKYCLSQKERKT